MTIDPYCAQTIAAQRDRSLTAAAGARLRSDQRATPSPTRPLRHRIAAGLRRGADLLEPPQRATARGAVAH